MRITLTGPRSVGKSTIGKLLAQKMKLTYVSSDEIGEQALKKEGGLDKAIKSWIIGKMIQEKGYSLIKQAYRQENIVFDLSGGAFASRKWAEASEEVRILAKEKSLIIGLLPSKNKAEARAFLYTREKERPHFKALSEAELKAKIADDYPKFPTLFKKVCDLVVYVKGKSPETIVEEIQAFLASHSQHQ
jgi:shikimate kinase